MKSIRIAFSVAASLIAVYVFAGNRRHVDYRFAPDWHCSTPAFPDDSLKTLVGPQGQLLYGYGGPFFPHAQNVGFNTVIHMVADEDQKFIGQRLESAKVPFVITSSVLDCAEISQTVLSVSEEILDRKDVRPFSHGREDIVVTYVTNRSSDTLAFSPEVTVNSIYEVSVSERSLKIGEAGSFSFSLPAVQVRQGFVPGKISVILQGIKVAPGATSVILGMYDNGLGSDLMAELVSDPSSVIDRIPAVIDFFRRWWQDDSGVPYGHINVPDPEIQNLADASARGIWQAREIKDGQISFQVGPTCYRGLWIVDGAFISEAAAILGKGEDARNGIVHTLSYQKPSGEFAKLNPTFWKENGIVLWTCIRHAMLTQDKEWLRSIWGKLSATAGFIRELRERTYSTPTPLDDGLVPAGYIDGGLNGSTEIPEYSNVLWNLIGIKAMIQGAKWLGKDEDADRLQSEYDDFYSCFRKASERDVATDDYGNMYLDDIMDPVDRDLPQRAQWTFCQSIYPGQLFVQDDLLAAGTMDMLETTLQEGMVIGTGWLESGIWNYFASFYGHANLWLGRSEKAADALYAFANHASPLYVWREEHNPRDLQRSFVGDMPHNWASAEFIRLLVHLLAIDRDSEMHLLEGIPEEWLQPGMKTGLESVATPFGRLTFTLEVSDDGRYAFLDLGPLSGDSCTGAVVHLSGWGTYKGKDTAVLDPSKHNKIRINIINKD